MARNLLRQDEAQSWVPAWFPVPQGTGETISVDHEGVLPRNRNFNPAVEPTTYVWKGFLEFFSMTQLKFVNTTSASFPSMSSTERTNGEKSVVRDSAYHVYLYFPSTNKPGAYTLVPSYRCPRLILQIWCQLWRQSGFPISPKWGRYLMSPIRSPPDIPPPLICCSPGVWGVCHLQIAVITLLTHL